MDTPIDFTITCTEKTSFIVYYIVSKGYIVDAGYRTLNKVNNFQLQVKTTINMLPKSTIIVATWDKQKWAFDYMDITFGQLRNNVST
ncbi:AGAP010831-PA-like protein [Anopheles sinensis]|uniref:A2M_N_2 domain-containing protein n=1 Tax=Anopheles sinensis TaxID=74873 RepID=A0A084VE86_ANOSI|nr:AGAP010831-PA-like protein [Anopheles sinensis]